MIRARDLREAYAKIRAVDRLNLELVAGETFGLLGPNGAGKTTTIHMLIGASRPDDGEVTINGSTDPTRPDVRRQIGWRRRSKPFMTSSVQRRTSPFSADCTACRAIV